MDPRLCNFTLQCFQLVTLYLLSDIGLNADVYSSPAILASSKQSNSRNLTGRPGLCCAVSSLDHGSYGESNGKVPKLFRTRFGVSRPSGISRNRSLVSNRYSHCVYNHSLCRAELSRALCGGNLPRAGNSSRQISESHRSATPCATRILLRDFLSEGHNHVCRRSHHSSPEKTIRIRTGRSLDLGSSPRFTRSEESERRVSKLAASFETGESR